MSDIKVGDIFNGGITGDVEVIYISPFNEFVIKFDDGSVDIVENEDVFFDTFHKEEQSLKGFLSVIRDVESGTVFFEEVYEEEEDAYVYFDSVGGTYQLVGLVPVAWNSNDG